MENGQEGGIGGYYFLIQNAVLMIGFLIHVFADRHADRRTKPRVIGLAMLWAVVGVGSWSLIAGIGHIGPNSDDVAADIGFAQSMFQWELGWADIGLGILAIGCVWKRDGWLTAAVVMLVVMYIGDLSGHIMEYVAHDNDAPNNVWAIPSDFFQPVVAVIMFIAYRRTRSIEPAASPVAA